MADASLYIAAGALVGALVGLTGVGGGSLMTPLLILAFGQPPSVAVGTDLLFASLTKIVATGSFGLSRRIAWPIVGRLALGSLPGAAIVLGVLAYTERRDWHADPLVVSALGALLVLTALSMLLERGLRRPSEPRIPPDAGGAEHPRTWATVLLGAALGVAVTLTSVGAGALGTVALLFLFPRLSMDRLVGTDIAHAVPLTLLAGLGHASLGHLDLKLLAALLTGSVPAVLLASRLAVRLPQRLLRLLIALVLLLVGVKILWPR